MQHNTDINDLEYLAGLGFEKADVSDKDIQRLKKQIRSRSVSYNSSGYFAFLCILTGVFIGVSAVVTIYNKQINFSIPQDKAFRSSPTVSLTRDVVAGKNLDTVEVKPENFIRPTKNKNTRGIQIKNVFTEHPEVLEPTVISQLNEKGFPNSEKELRYIPNSPVLYIHDLKVTEYHKLYFNASRYIAIPANKSISAAMAARVENMNNIPGSPPELYLHQLLSEALLAFKRTDYSRSQFLLSELEQHNSADINVLFYSGMCYYYKKSYDLAVQKLDECLSNKNNSFFNEAQYYKALCLLEGGEKDSAMKLFKEIANENGFYSVKAKQILER